MKNIIFITAGVALLWAISKKAMTITFIKPLAARITSPFGMRTHPVTKEKQMHQGIDLAAAEGTKLIAPADAVVKSVYENSKGGIQVILEHPGGWRTGYAHLQKVIYPMGTKLERGAVFAYTGKTGAVTAAHLHMTLRNPKGEFIDPEKFIYPKA